MKMKPRMTRIDANQNHNFFYLAYVRAIRG